MYTKVSLARITDVALALPGRERGVFDVRSEDNVRGECGGSWEGFGTMDCAGQLQGGRWRDQRFGRGARGGEGG